MLLTETGIEEKSSKYDVPPRFASLEEWLRWQENLHFTAIDLGLDRCREVAGRLQLSPFVPFVISIAGTNGKGSSAHMLESILRAAGYRVGLYTSPHLVRYNERIRVNGREAGDRVICDAFDRVDRARGNISLTYFEFGTLAAIDIFRSGAVDIAVMEVGLGGRLDAVNILDADISMITTIDMDHQQWLGNDRDSIGREKSGIFRSGRPAVCADPDPPASVPESAGMAGADLLLSGLDYCWEIHGDNWSWSARDIEYNR